MANCPFCNTPDFYPSFSGKGECLQPSCKLFSKEHFAKTLQMPVTKADMEKELASVMWTGHALSNGLPGTLPPVKFHYGPMPAAATPSSSVRQLTEMAISGSLPTTHVLYVLLGAVNVPRMDVVTALRAGNDYVHRDVLPIGVHEVDIFIQPSPLSAQRLRLLRLGDEITFSLMY